MPESNLYYADKIISKLLKYPHYYLKSSPELKSLLLELRSLTRYINSVFYEFAHTTSFNKFYFQRFIQHKPNNTEDIQDILQYQQLINDHSRNSKEVDDFMFQWIRKNKIKATDIVAYHEYLLAKTKNAIGGNLGPLLELEKLCVRFIECLRKCFKNTRHLVFKHADTVHSCIQAIKLGLEAIHVDEQHIQVSIALLSFFPDSGFIPASQSIDVLLGGNNLQDLDSIWKMSSPKGQCYGRVMEWYRQIQSQQDNGTAPIFSSAYTIMHQQHQTWDINEVSQKFTKQNIDKLVHNLRLGQLYKLDFFGTENVAKGFKYFGHSTAFRSMLDNEGQQKFEFFDPNTGRYFFSSKQDLSDYIYLHIAFFAQSNTVFIDNINYVKLGTHPKFKISYPIPIVKVDAPVTLLHLYRDTMAVYNRFYTKNVHSKLSRGKSEWFAITKLVMHRCNDPYIIRQILTHLQNNEEGTEFIYKKPNNRTNSSLFVPHEQQYSVQNLISDLRQKLTQLEILHEVHAITVKPHTQSSIRAHTLT